MKLRKYIKLEIYDKFNVGRNIIKKLYFKYINVTGNAIYLIRKRMTTKSKIKESLLRRKLILKYGISIESHTIIGEGLYIHHPTSIVLTGKIGKNFKVYQNVTIGRGGNMLDKDNEPTIGDNVTVF